MNKPTIDNEAMKQAILKELARQGVEFAQVNIDVLSSDEIHFNVHPAKESNLNPKYVEMCRVSNQIVWEKVTRGDQLNNDLKDQHRVMNNHRNENPDFASDLTEAEFGELVTLAQQADSAWFRTPAFKTHIEAEIIADRAYFNTPEGKQFIEAWKATKAGRALIWQHEQATLDFTFFPMGEKRYLKGLDDKAGRVSREDE